MWPFSNKNTPKEADILLHQKHESRFERLHDFLSIAFDKVKQDIHNVRSWIEYFNNKHSHHDSRINNLHQRLESIEKKVEYLPYKSEDIRKLIDYSYAYSDIVEKINRLSTKVEHIESKSETLHKKFDQNSHSSQSYGHDLKEKVNIRQRLVKKITKGSKEYVKSVILSLIRKYKEISAYQLREIIVEEQGLCSKSSFYRLLKEIEELPEINVERGLKEKSYFIDEKLVKQ